METTNTPKIAYITNSHCKTEHIREMLRTLGYEWLLFNNLLEYATKNISDRSIRCIIIDCGSLNVEQEEWVFRQIIDQPNMPVLIVSCEHVNMSELVSNCLNTGQCHLVDVDISLQALKSSLDMMFKLHRLTKYLINSNRQLEDSEAMLHTIVDTLPDLVWVKDPQGVYLTCNHRFEDYVGRNKTQIIGKTDYDLNDREIADFFRENDRLAIEAGRPRMNEEHLVFAIDGHEEDVETIKTPILDMQKRLLGILGVARDITHRKKVEQTMVQLNNTLERRVKERTDTLNIITERLSLATKAGHMAAWDWDLSTNEIWWDPMMYEIFEIDPKEEFTPMEKWEQIVDSDQWQNVMKESQEAIANKDSYEVTYSVRIGNNEIRYITAFGAVIRDDSGVAHRLVGVNMDVTQKVEYELKITEAKEIAEQATIAKSNFLANMSHEIRTPINAIVGMNYLLSKTDLSEKQKDYNHKIKISSEQLLRIVTDILDFSKVEAGKMRLEHIHFNLRTVINNIYEVHYLEALNKGLKFRIKVDELVPDMLIGDPLRLSQVLNNLVHNAIKFTKVGAIMLMVRFIKRDDGKAKLYFEVNDSGIGLTKEQQENLFVAFQQADSSTTRNYGGTGLGLAISQEIVHMFGGDIQVESTYGSGSVFHFIVNVECFDEVHVLNNEKVEEPKLRDGLKILVVEDNAINQQLTREILEEKGALVHVADNGESAVEMLESDLKVDLVLMDLQMPIMDGRQAVARIRRQKNFDGMPVLALTAEMTKQTKEELLSHGFNDYIPKPINVDTMIRIIKKWENVL